MDFAVYIMNGWHIIKIPNKELLTCIGINCMQIICNACGGAE